MAKTPLQSSNHHVVPTTTYFFTFLALVVLMIATVVIAEFNLPGFWIFSGTVVNQTIALVIALMKALLVIFIFMGIRWSTTLTRLWALTGFVWFSLFYIILADYGTRKYEPVPSWDGKGEAALPRNPAPERPNGAEAHAGSPLDPNDINVRPRQ